MTVRPDAWDQTLVGYVGVASARHLALALMLKTSRCSRAEDSTAWQSAPVRFLGIPLGNPTGNYTPSGIPQQWFKICARAQQWFKIYALGIRRRFAGNDSYVFLAAIIFLTM